MPAITLCKIHAVFVCVCRDVMPCCGIDEGPQRGAVLAAALFSFFGLSNDEQRLRRSSSSPVCLSSSSLPFVLLPSPPSRLLTLVISHALNLVFFLVFQLSPDRANTRLPLFCVFAFPYIIVFDAVLTSRVVGVLSKLIRVRVVVSLQLCCGYKPKEGGKNNRNKRATTTSVGVCPRCRPDRFVCPCLCVDELWMRRTLWEDDAKKKKRC